MLQAGNMAVIPTQDFTAMVNDGTCPECHHWHKVILCAQVAASCCINASNNSQVYQLCSYAMFDSPISAVCRSHKMVTSFTFASEQDLNLTVQQSIALTVGKCTCNVKYKPVSHVYLTMWWSAIRTCDKCTVR